MALVVTHTLVSAIPDGADASLVQPSDWNADHTIVGTLSTWSPTIAPTSGAFTTITLNAARYLQIGKWVVGMVDYTITSVGTASGVTTITVPVTAASNNVGACYGMEIVSTGTMIGGQVSNSQGIVVRRYDGTGGMATGYRNVINFGYEAA